MKTTKHNLNAIAIGRHSGDGICICAGSNHRALNHFVHATFGLNDASK